METEHSSLSVCERCKSRQSANIFYGFEVCNECYKHLKDEEDKRDYSKWKEGVKDGTK